MEKKKTYEKRKMRLSPTQMIAFSFAAIILLGALLLMLPVSSRNGVTVGFVPALFTATSATCVTGLTPFDTWSQWSGFGQIVLICMIEIGGLGFMSAASFVVLLLRRKVGLKQRMVMAQALSVNDMAGIVRLQRLAIFGSLLIQLAGALILMLRFLPEHGIGQAVKWGLFHSISAFCNAGFDIFGVIEPGSSLQVFQSDPVVLTTLGALITIGGLGFFVWEDLLRNRKWKNLSVYTKLVLSMTGALLIIGAVGICILEWNNPDTLGAMTWQDKLFNGLFQSATLRTAGFDALNQGAMTESSKAFSMFFMIIGGSSGSTAGGIKTVTMMVLLLFLWSRIRRKGNVSIFKRSIPDHQVMDAMTIVAIMVGLAFFGGLFISVTSSLGFMDSLFESVSALATVGLTTGVTPELSLPSQILVMIYMYFGRVGVLTLSLGFLMGSQAQERFRYANTNLLIG